jgi:hypothetical protein
VDLDAEEIADWTRRVDAAYRRFTVSWISYEWVILTT